MQIMTMPTTMKAAVLVGQREPLVIADVALPSALLPGQVLVKVHCSGICGSQLGEIDGAKGADKFLPHLLGHEGSGTVVEIGPTVRHVKTGDKVVLHWRKGLGIEASPPQYQWNGKVVNAGWITTFNEYAIVAENRVTPIPADSDMDVAALFGCAVTTGFGPVEVTSFAISSDTMAAHTAHMSYADNVQPEQGPEFDESAPVAGVVR